MIKYLSMLCAVLGIFLLTIVDTALALPVLLLGVILSVITIKQWSRTIGIISLIINGVP
ncbi:hypothetical protein ACTWP4_06675 [Gracilibacillus sp. D59]|uniref:hypothetical protein n=1 Tax=Gracilibacillus sp. D59 TaxID=3457434 RepID=UPI003FCDC437